MNDSSFPAKHPAETAPAGAPSLAHGSPVSDYDAPWGRALCVISITISAASALIFAFGFPTVSPNRTPVVPWLWALLPGVILVSALFTIRGYRVEGATLAIRRLFWTTCLPLAGLVSATVERNALKGSIRIFGNGGLFSFTGWYWSRRLGRFRAFVTDLRSNVVLRFVDRTIVLSPDRPEEFAREVMRATRQGRRGA